MWGDYARGDRHCSVWDGGGLRTSGSMVTGQIRAGVGRWAVAAGDQVAQYPQSPTAFSPHLPPEGETWRGVGGHGPSCARRDSVGAHCGEIREGIREATLSVTQRRGQRRLESPSVHLTPVRRHRQPGFQFLIPSVPQAGWKTVSLVGCFSSSHHLLFCS